MIEDFDRSLHELAIDVHGVLIEPVIEVISELLFLSFAVSGVAQIVLVERVLEDILWFNHVYVSGSFALFLLH
jgi:hypothetical protein